MIGNIFRDMSIKSKLSAIMLLISSIMLLLASSAFVVNEMVSFRRNMIADLYTIADIVGTASIGALLFDDTKTAGESVATLKAKPHIIRAHIFKEGVVIASYFREGTDREKLPLYANFDDYTRLNPKAQDIQTKDKYFFHKDYIEVFKQIIYEKETVSHVYIQSDLDELYDRLAWISLVVIAVMGVSLIVAFLIASKLQQFITTPVYDLLNTMRAVTSHKDYGIRAVKSVNDEIGSLIDGFNEMLSQIEMRDTELGQYRGHLEELVTRRTAELEEARDQAMAANKAKSAFLANMSHELRTPLNGILGYTQILNLDKTLTEKQREGVHIIQRSGEYLLTLINDILDLSKIEAGRTELYLTDFNFGDFLQSITELFQMRAQQKGISFVLEPLSHLPRGIRADEKRLRQILINLLGNAVKFTDCGGVTFKIGYHNSQMRFQIEDTGIGIAECELERIFLPFQQVGDWLHKSEGSGLGLSITKTLVEMMEGELLAESTPGQGSVFSVILNLPEASALIKSGKEDEPVIIGFEGRARTILVIDDKWENRSVMVNLLKPLGFNLIEASNGQEGLTKAREFSPDLIVTDLVMPVLDGFEAVRQMRRLPALKNTPIIAASASVFDCHQQESIDAGCSTFIMKPFRAKEMLELLRKYLGLQWIYETSTEAEADTQEKTALNDIEDAFIGPSAEQATVLYDLGMMGDIRGILEYVETFEKTNKQLTPFTCKIRQLAKNFQEEEICELVQKYM